MIDQHEDQHRHRGRPREFDLDSALDGAIAVFQNYGFHACSIPDLANGMGVTPGSIYKAFKDKRAVFLAAFDRSRSLRTQRIEEMLTTCDSGRTKILCLLTLYAKESCGESGRRGCLVVGSAIELASFDDEMAKRVTQALTQNERLLQKLVLLGQQDNSISSKQNPSVLARSLLCLMQGMRVLGKVEPKKQDMLATIDVAMKMLD